MPTTPGTRSGSTAPTRRKQACSQYALAGATFGLILAVTTLSLRTTTGGPFRRVALSGLILAAAIT